MNPESWGEMLKKYWKQLTLVGIFIFGIIGGFLFPPPPGTYTQYDESITRLGQFTVSIVAGLVFLLAYVFRKQGHTLGWGVTAGITFLVSLLLFLAYASCSESFTTEYNGVPVVIGPESAYTEFAKEYKQKNPGMSNSELMMDVAGDLEAIWVPSSIDQRRLILWLMYVLCLPFFTVCILSLLHALYCLRGGQGATINTPESPPSNPGIERVDVERHKTANASNLVKIAKPRLT